MSNTKMKGLLKGLRYISQIFENEKDGQMQIGNPTDVKHVAHIGWDGPAVNNAAPSWMNGFKGPPGSEEPEDSASKFTSQDSVRKPTRGNSSSSSQEMTGLAKPTRQRSSSDGLLDSPTKEKPRRRSSRNSNKELSESTNKSGRKIKNLSNQGIECDSSSNLADVPKKVRPKKPKDNTGVGPSRTSRRAQTDQVSDSERILVSNNQGSSDLDERQEKENI